MTTAICNRIETTTLDTHQPIAYYTCSRCGYRHVMSRDNYCPNCGKFIYSMFTIRKEVN